MVIGENDHISSNSFLLQSFGGRERNAWRGQISDLESNSSECMTLRRTRDKRAKPLLEWGRICTANAARTARRTTGIACDGLLRISAHNIFSRFNSGCVRATGASGYYLRLRSLQSVNALARVWSREVIMSSRCTLLAFGASLLK